MGGAAQRTSHQWGIIGGHCLVKQMLFAVLLYELALLLLAQATGGASKVAGLVNQNQHCAAV